MGEAPSKCTVEAAGVSKTYPTGTRALEEVDLTMGPGVHAIMGPNGSGKTTFLSIIAGALSPTGGEVRVCGHSVWGRGWREARREIGFAPQDAPLRERLTVLENLIWYASTRGVGLGDAARRAREVLGMLGLEGRLSERIQRLSGGMRRRVIIAAALMARPRVLLLDEPSSGLDPNARRELWGHLERLVREGEVEVLVYTTHLAQEAEAYSTVVHIFHRGHRVASGRPGELVRRHAPLARVVLSTRGDAGGGWLGSVEGVEDYRVDDGRVIAYTRDPDSLLPRIVEEALSRGLGVERVEVSRPGLEDVFYRLTGARLSGEGAG